MVDNIKPKEINEAVSDNDDWSKWANFVLISLEKLGNSVAELHSEYFKIRESLLKELAKIKEEVRLEVERKIESCEEEDKRRLERFKKALETIIETLTNRIVELEKTDLVKYIDDKIQNIRDDEISPIRNRQISVFSKLGLIAAMASVLGGSLVVFLLGILKGAFLGGG
jgi:hypothetical protein